MQSTDCFHCGLPAPADSKFHAVIEGVQQPMCCLGCQAVAEAIVENHLEDFYRYRTANPKTATELIPEALSKLALYDHAEVQKSFVFSSASGNKEASLILEGITCAACIWLNERHLMQLPGVSAVSINYSTHRARISWDDAQIKLSHILAEIKKLGYDAHPYSPQQQDQLRAKQRKLDIRRIAVAGLFSGQVMMIAVALYAGAAQGMEHATTQILRAFSLMLSVPVMTYAAIPFYRSAWTALSRRQVNMDVPISLGIMLGFTGSVWATAQASGQVYFDTITMLVFFLLTTRYLERNIREKSVESAENLLRLAPAMATRIDGETQTLVAVIALSAGDIILAKPGETIAADGVVTSGESSVDESLLTGESRALHKVVGSQVLAGSVNYEHPIYIKVSHVGEETVLASIARLLDRAQSQKPHMAQLADRLAEKFTWALLGLVALVGLSWWVIAPSRALEIMLSVLVVSCPCALSLAAPAAFAAASGHLIRRGVLLTRAHALETLAQVNRLVFDKTGTLTLGKPVITQVISQAALSADEALRIAASLEQASEHPLAKAFLSGYDQSLYALSQPENLAGQGVAGLINGKRYTLGNISLLNGLAQVKQADCSVGATQLWLADGEQVIASFVVQDALRPQSATLIHRLQSTGYQLSMLSGDAVASAQYFAQMLGIADWQAALNPADKLAALQQMQRRGEVVAMVGDGINDAPVLAGAQVSFAMGSGTQMARTAGDIILLNENLLEIDHALHTAKLTMRVIRQNFAWALGYNLITVPFAATGHLSPLLAAIGMSVSSLVVVLNALRLR